MSNRFVIEQLEYLEHCELSLLRTGFWWGHQDLYVVTKLAGATSPPIVDSTVYRTDDKVHGYVDSVSIVEEKSPVQRRRILRATGWVSPDVTGNKSADRIIVLLRGDDGLQFSHEARRCERPDVVTHFHNPALLDTGFKVETDISALTEKLTLFLAIRSSDEAKLCPNVSIPLADWMRKSKPG